MVFVDVLIELYTVLNNKFLIIQVVVLVVDQQQFHVHLLIQLVLELHLHLVVLVVLFLIPVDQQVVVIKQSQVVQEVYSVTVLVVHKSGEH
jgi:hypothetical protein